VKKRVEDTINLYGLQWRSDVFVEEKSIESHQIQRFLDQEASELKTVEGLERMRRKCGMYLSCFFSSVSICL